MAIHFDDPEGATPIRDYSHLKLPGTTSQQDLNRAEAESISAAQILGKPKTSKNS